jgi:hypothetical protein
MATLFERGQALALRAKAQFREARAQGVNVRTMFHACYRNAADYEAVHAALGSTNVHPWEEYQQKMAGFISSLSDIDPIRFVEIARSDYISVLKNAIEEERLRIGGELPAGSATISATVAMLGMQFPNSALKPSEVITKGLS